mgnify:CR=1 FL=1
MINLTLRQLRYFDALARHGHFGRAANACSISQPALSMQIKEMEEALGGALLERSARQVTLTRLGEELIERLEAHAIGKLGRARAVRGRGIDDADEADAGQAGEHARMVAAHHARADDPDAQSGPGRH